MAINIIDPDNGPGTDFTSLSAWEASLSGTLTEVETAECRASSGTADTSPVVMSGFTPTAANYAEIKNHSDESIGETWNDSNYRLSVNDDYPINIQVGYVRTHHLQFERTFTSASWAFGVQVSLWASGDVRFHNCIFRTDPVGNIGAFGASGSADPTISVYNCIVPVADTDGFWAANSSVLDLYNCTACNCGRNGVNEGGSSIINAINCIVADTGSSNFGVAIGTIDYCASDDGDGTNPQILSATRSDDFEDFANDDFKLVSGSVCVDNGTDDPASGLYSDDFLGNSRSSPWDIGAFELVSGPVSQTILTDLKSYLNQLDIEQLTDLKAYLELAGLEQLTDLKSYLAYLDLEQLTDLKSYLNRIDVTELTDLKAYLEVLQSRLTDLKGYLRQIDIEILTDFKSYIAYEQTLDISTDLKGYIWAINEVLTDVKSYIQRIDIELSTDLKAYTYQALEIFTDLRGYLNTIDNLVSSDLKGYLNTIDNLISTDLKAYMYQAEEVFTDLKAYTTGTIGSLTDLKAYINQIGVLRLTDLRGHLVGAEQFPHVCFQSTGREKFKSTGREKFASARDRCPSERIIE